MTVEEFKETLRKELHNMHNESTGQKTWTDKEADAMTDALSDREIQYYINLPVSPEEYAATISQ